MMRALCSKCYSKNVVEKRSRYRITHVCESCGHVHEIIGYYGKYKEKEEKE